MNQQLNPMKFYTKNFDQNKMTNELLITIMFYFLKDTLINFEFKSVSIYN
jgi:hypothetical protein